MRTLTLSILVLSLLAGTSFADPTSKQALLQEIKKKISQGIDPTQEEMKLLSEARQEEVQKIDYLEERGLAEVKIQEEAKKVLNFDTLNTETDLIEVLEENDTTEVKSVKKEITVENKEKQKPLVDDKKEYSFLDKAKALLFGPPTILADKAVKTIKKVHNTNIKAGTRVAKQIKSNAQSVLKFIQDNYNTIQNVSRDYADLHPATKSLNDFRIKMSRAGIHIALLSNPTLIRLYNAVNSDKKKVNKNNTKTDDISIDVSEIKEDVANLSKDELIGLILSQEIKLNKNNLPIKTKVSDFDENISFEELEKIYAQNVLTLGEDMDAIATKEESEIENKLHLYGEVDEYGRKITNLDEVVVTEEPLTEEVLEAQDITKDEIKNDTVSCPATKTDSVLSTQIAELKESFEKFQTEQSELNNTLMQTMAMNNLLMSQNNLMMSQMMLMQNMMMQNQIGERKGSLDDIIDSHYKNYMAAPNNGQYDPNAVNNTPFASNYLPQMSSQYEPNAFQSSSFFSTGPVNGLYSPGYNFSFGNTFDEPRRGPTQAELAEIFKVQNPLFVGSSNG